MNTETNVAEDTSTTTPEENLSEEQEQTSESTEETDEGAATEGSAGTPEEWVVPGRFKTVEDLKNSYRHAEAELTRRSQELSQLKRQASQTSANPERELTDFKEAVLKNPVEAVRSVARSVTKEALEEVKQVRFETEYNRFMQNENFKSLEPVMVQLASQNQDLIEEKGLSKDPRILPWLYYAALGVKQSEAVQNAERRGLQKGERSALKKAKNQTEGTSGSKGHTKPKFEDLDLKEMRKQLEKGFLS